MACRVGKLLCNETALFVCDLQEKFRPMIKYFPEIVEVASRLVKAAKILDMPVIVTEQYPKGLGSTVPEIGLDQFPDLVPVAKTQFSMWTEQVSKTLKEKHPNVKSVILCGIETHVCVQGTCLSLIENGYDVHVIVDGCSSRSMVDRMFGFDRMKATGAWLTTSESAILGLLGGSHHRKFKECQSLIMKVAPDSGLLTILQGLK